MLRSLLRELHAVARSAEQDDDDGGVWDASKSGAPADACSCSLLRDADGRLRKPKRLFKAQGVALRSEAVLDVLRLPAIAALARSLARTVHRIQKNRFLRPVLIN
eukprot:483339-Prymnesium_polylepis.2